MQPNLIYFKCLMVFLVMFICMCDSYKIKVRTKVKRKVNHIDQIRDNMLEGNGRPGNGTKATGRGFGSILTLGKVLNFFPVGGERECQPTHGYTVARSGICLNPYDCRQRDGKAAGDCAHGLGVCCVFEVTCGGVVQNNLTYFMSPGFPELWGEKKNCSISIDKAHAGIMQLRIDFVHFTIGQPNRTTGECDEDVMTLGEEGNQFRTCGQNHGQHIYHTLSTASEKREDDELPGHKKTRLLIQVRGPQMPRIWLMRLAQMPLAHSAPHDCLQYYTDTTGTISTFNYAVNGRYLAGQDYRACVRRNAGYCAIKYSPCDERSFRIGSTNSLLTYSAYLNGPGSSGGPGTGFYGPEGSFVPGETSPNIEPTTVDTSPPANPDQQPVETQNDPVAEDGMMPADQTQTQEDDMEGSGADPQIESAVETGVPAQSISSRIWSFIWPSWLWGQRSRVRTWGYWSPYAQHYEIKDDDEFLYQGYGQFGINFRGFGRQGCQDRITIPCDNEYLISNTSYIPGVCDPHHCGSSFCPGVPFESCHVQSSISPFAVSIHFGPPAPKGSAEDNIGACLAYTQLPCNS